MFDFKNDMIYADVDEARLIQTVRHIIGTAVQTMPGGCTIRVSAETDRWPEEDGHETEKKPCARLTFQGPDAGPWLRDLERDLGSVFTDRHAGLVVIDSRPGGDAAIHIYLPLVSLDEDPLDDSIYMEDLPMETGRGRLLVMDDEAFIRELAEEMLMTLGYEVVLVNDGEETIAAYKAALEAGERFDAVILDLTVHNAMGGLEAIERLLEIDPDIKAIISSGYSNDPVMSNYKHYGFQRAVQKPYRVQDIDETLSQVLHK